MSSPAYPTPDISDTYDEDPINVRSTDDDYDSEDFESELSDSSGSQVPNIRYATSFPQPHKVDRLIDQHSPAAQGGVTSMITKMRPHVDFETGFQGLSISDQIRRKEFETCRTAPIFTSGVGKFLETYTSHHSQPPASFSQFGLIGLNHRDGSSDDDLLTSEDDTSDPEDDLVIANLDMPWSAFICGSQGAGKSHTLSCLLENALLSNSTIGVLSNPLAAMVFHYDNYTSASSSQICEAAYLCSSGVPVTVLVSPSNIWSMTQLYSNLPGLPINGPKPRVLPLYLSEKLLDISTMLKLMSIDPSSESIPLYMETVMSILREMAMEGKGNGAFSYSEFRARLDAIQWASGQIVPLSLRLQLLDSFLEPTMYTRSTRPAPAKADIWAFEPGTMTIVDLSDPFVNSNDACSLFSICLSLFLEDRGKCGRMVALDEAHKFLLQSGAAKVLTNDLTSIIRQQRHTGTRVVIATQEPTLSPDLIDLCNATFVHRFNSPAWYEVLRKHLAGANKHDSRSKYHSLFDSIVALETGEALLFCPTALVDVDPYFEGSFTIKKMGNEYMKVKIRKRVTADGGRSILASETAVMKVIPGSQNIPMHIVNKSVSSGPPGRGKSKVAQLLGPVTVETNAVDLAGIDVTPTLLNTPVVAFTASVPPSTPPTPPKPAIPAQKFDTAPTATTATQSFQHQQKIALSTKDHRDGIQKEARAQMRRLYKERKWTDSGSIGWRRLYKAIESALSLPHGLIEGRPEYVKCVKAVALDEHARCRRAKASN